MQTAEGGLAWVHGLTQSLAPLLLSLPWPAILIVAAAPVALAASSRSVTAACGAAAFSALSVIAVGNQAGQGAPLAALALQGGAFLLGMHGFAQRRRERAMLELSKRLSDIHRELTGFLDALDARTRTVDRLLSQSSKAGEIDAKERSRETT